MFAKSTRLSLVEGWGAGLEDCTCPLHCTLECISGSLCSAEHCLKILMLVDFFAYSRSPGGLRLWIEAHFHTWLRVGRVSRHSDSWRLSIPFYTPFIQRNRVHFLLNHFFGFTALLILEQQRAIKIHARAKIKLLFSVTWLTCHLGWPYPAFQTVPGSKHWWHEQHVLSRFGFPDVAKLSGMYDTATSCSQFSHVLTSGSGVHHLTYWLGWHSMITWRLRKPRICRFAVGVAGRGR